jgi:hypothetical protein
VEQSIGPLSLPPLSADVADVVVDAVVDADVPVDVAVADVSASPTDSPPLSPVPVAVMDSKGSSPIFSPQPATSRRPAENHDLKRLDDDIRPTPAVTITGGVARVYPPGT